MGDQAELAELIERWHQSAHQTDEARVLRFRVYLGLLRQPTLEQAAALGHPAAVEALEEPPGEPQRWPDWLATIFVPPEPGRPLPSAYQLRLKDWERLPSYSRGLPPPTPEPDEPRLIEQALWWAGVWGLLQPVITALETTDLWTPRGLRESIALQSHARYLAAEWARAPEPPQEERARPWQLEERGLQELQAATGHRGRAALAPLVAVVACGGRGPTRLARIAGLVDDVLSEPDAGPAPSPAERRELLRACVRWATVPRLLGDAHGRLGIERPAPVHPSATEETA